MAHGVDTSQLIEPLRINSIMTDSLVRAFLRASALTSIGETLEMALLVRDINILSVNRWSQVVSQIGCQTCLVSSRVHKDPISSSRRSHSFSRLPPWMLGTNVALSLFFFTLNFLSSDCLWHLSLRYQLFGCAPWSTFPFTFSYWVCSSISKHMLKYCFKNVFPSKYSFVCITDIFLSLWYVIWLYDIFFHTRIIKRSENSSFFVSFLGVLLLRFKVSHYTQVFMNVL